MAKVCFDTNVLLSHPEVLDEFDDIVLHSAVLEELDRQKTLGNELGFKARETNRRIENARLEGKITWITKDVYNDMPSGWDINKNDNKIVMGALEYNIPLYSNDLNVRAKADVVNVEIRSYGDGQSKDKDEYKGWRLISGTTDEINDFYQKIYDGEITFLTNEYLITKNIETNDVNEQRFNGERFVSLNLPPSRVIKAMNPEQRCALDLLYNKDIPIKIINGSFGSGKTLLTTKVGLHMTVDKGVYGSLTYLRNPLVADGTEIGFLKGTKEDKIREYMSPLLQYVQSDNNQAYVEMLIKNEQLKLDVISFLKGVNIDDSFVVCDEAEDLNVKLIKLIGSRIAKKSVIVFTGDYKQAENKYKNNNGLLKLINETKGNSLVGIVNLPEDLRSSASRVFADL